MSSPKGLFVMKGYEPGLINKYWCVPCRNAGVEHEVIEVPGPPTDSSCHWGVGLPTTRSQCTVCGAQDGPQVSSELVGGFW